MSGYQFYNAGQITESDQQKLSKMLEEYFGTQSDSDQMPIDDSARPWIENIIPECAKIIKYDDEVVGSSFIFPSSLDLMNDFLGNRINEAQLAQKVQAEKITYETMEAIYLCSSFVVPAHRGKNLSVKSIVKSIQEIMPENKCLPLFYWQYSPAGAVIASKVAQILELPLFTKSSK